MAMHDQWTSNTVKEVEEARKCRCHSVMGERLRLPRPRPPPTELST